MSTHALARTQLPVGLAVVLMMGIAGPAFACEPDRTEARAAAAVAPAAAGGIEPGSVNRTSLNLSATYSVVLSLRYGSRAFNVNSTATITNTSGGPIDRVELNVVPARLGGLVLRAVEVDGKPASRRIDDQTVIVQLGGILPAGASTKLRVQYRSTLRTSISGTNWLFTKANGIVDAYRWIPWISRATPFDRPNFGDPFVLPASPFVRVTVQTDRRLVIASTADRVSISPDGLTQTLQAANVRDVSFTAAPDFKSR